MPPAVDVSDYSMWRGDVDPGDRATWWTCYSRMIAHYATLAERGGAATFVIGTELERLTGPSEQQRWRELAIRTRERFSGTLTYATNELSDPERVTFWDALDCIGINVYPDLDDRDGAPPSAEELMGAWTGHARNFAACRSAGLDRCSSRRSGIAARSSVCVSPGTGRA